jgi:hypothetical protein
MDFELILHILRTVPFKRRAPHALIGLKVLDKASFNYLISFFCFYVLTRTIKMLLTILYFLSVKIDHRALFTIMFPNSNKIVQISLILVETVETLYQM